MDAPYRRDAGDELRTGGMHRLCVLSFWRFCEKNGNYIECSKMSFECRILPGSPTVEPHPMVSRIMQCFAGGGYTNGASPMNRASQEAFRIEQEIRADERERLAIEFEKRWQLEGRVVANTLRKL